MNYRSISNSDFIIIFALDYRVQEITDLYKDYKKYESDLSEIIKEQNFLRRRKLDPNPTHEVDIKLIKKEFDTVSEKYNHLLNIWNKEMDSIMVKYDYIQLSLFLKENPILGSWGKQPSHKYALLTKKIANSIGITVLRQLYSGEPCFINYYPKEWLQKVYLKIYSTKDEKNINFKEFEI